MKIVNHNSFGRDSVSIVLSLVENEHKLIIGTQIFISFGKWLVKLINSSRYQTGDIHQVAQLHLNPRINTIEVVWKLRGSNENFVQKFKF